LFWTEREKTFFYGRCRFSFGLLLFSPKKKNCSQKRKKCARAQKSAQKKRRGTDPLDGLNEKPGALTFKPPTPARNGMPNGTTNGPAPAAGR
jgi:hypothetical protein